MCDRYRGKRRCGNRRVLRQSISNHFVAVQNPLLGFVAARIEFGTAIGASSAVISRAEHLRVPPGRKQFSLSSLSVQPRCYRTWRQDWKSQVKTRPSCHVAQHQSTAVTTSLKPVLMEVHRFPYCLGLPSAISRLTWPSRFHRPSHLRQHFGWTLL